MGRIIATAVIVAAIAAAITYYVWLDDQATLEAQKKQIVDLTQQVDTLRHQNEQLSTALSKVQNEESRLAADNETLSKAIAQYKATGKMPELKLPYPPK